MSDLERGGGSGSASQAPVPDSPPQTLAVRCVGLSKHFGRAVAVECLDLELRRGQFVALLGPSGCGKTTTLRLIAGFERPDAGAVEIAGSTVVGPGVFVQPERRRVGMVFQDGALFPHMSVAENIAYGLPRNAEQQPRVNRMLEFVGLSYLGSRMPHELSGGQQQRVALARALAPRPAVVLLDEPFANLDARLRARLRGELRAILHRANVTVILVTHDQDEAMSFADEVAVMWQGQVLQRASPTDLYQKPATRTVASFLGEANFLRGEAENGQVTTELGVLAAAEDAGGPVEVLVRPEAIRLFLDGTSGFRVTDAEFYGHDRIFYVDLSSGTRLRVRNAGESYIRLGDHVRIQVQGPVLTFPRA